MKTLYTKNSLVFFVILFFLVNINLYSLDNNIYGCPKCGYISTELKPPQRCPICGGELEKVEEGFITSGRREGKILLNSENNFSKDLWAVMFYCDNQKHFSSSFCSGKKVKKQHIKFIYYCPFCDKYDMYFSHPGICPICKKPLWRHYTIGWGEENLKEDEEFLKELRKKFDIDKEKWISERKRKKKEVTVILDKIE
jgi:Zn finger protein HypA/HybF involved in hydrogenase expression